ncbi:hypothetical protein SEA_WILLIAMBOONE_147 [Gordonia phage WilliamBoone]|nr:hypothetical protein SEA_WILLIAMBOONE_147 [Gordonia phage WilliamBoone]
MTGRHSMSTFAPLLPPLPLDPIVNEAKSGQLLYEIVGSDQQDTTVLLWAGLGVLAALDDFRVASQAVATTQARALVSRCTPSRTRSFIVTGTTCMARRSISLGRRVMGV